MTTQDRGRAEARPQRNLRLGLLSTARIFTQRGEYVAGLGIVVELALEMPRHAIVDEHARDLRRILKGL